MAFNFVHDDSEKHMCPDCGHDKYVVDWKAGDCLCPNCGLVHEGHIIDDRPEWRNFSDSGVDKSRCGEAIEEDAARGSGLGIGRGGAKKGTLSPTVIQQVKPQPIASSNTSVVSQRRLQQVHQRLASETKDKTLAREIETMNGLMQSQGFTLVQAVRDAAIDLYVDFRKQKRVNGEQMRGVMAYCAMMASRAEAGSGKGGGRTLSEVCSAFSTDKTMVAAARKKVKSVCKEDDMMNTAYKSIMSARGSDTTDAMTRMINVLFPLGEFGGNRKDAGYTRFQLIKKSRELDSFVKERSLVGSNDPERFAMAIIFIACREMGMKDINENTFVKHFKVSTHTIQKHTRTLRNALSDSLDKPSSLSVRSTPGHESDEAGHGLQHLCGAKNNYAATVSPPPPPPSPLLTCDGLGLNNMNDANTMMNTDAYMLTPPASPSSRSPPPLPGWCSSSPLPALPCPSPLVSAQKTKERRLAGDRATACETPTKRP